MASLREYSRRSAIPFLGAVLALAYLFVFVPQNQKLKELDQPLQKEWRALTASLGKTNATSIDFLSITNQLDQTKRAFSVVRGARDSARRLLALDPQLRDRMASGSFQLIEYQIESSQRKDALASLAKKQKVLLDPSVLIGFPEYTVDVTEPELLWASLTMVSGILTAAVQSHVSAIHSLSVPVVLTNRSNVPRPTSVTELPLQLEVTGPVRAITTLLQSVPLRGPDAQQLLGLSEVPKDKPALFIQHLVIKKQTPEQPDEVRLLVRLMGFVFRE